LTQLFKYSQSIWAWIDLLLSLAIELSIVFGNLGNGYLHKFMDRLECQSANKLGIPVTDCELDLNLLEKHDLIKTHNSQSYIALN